MKTVFITGGHSGIGKETAKIFSNQGFHCVLLGRDRAKLKSAAVELDATIVVADLQDPDIGKKVIAELQKEEIKELQCLIHCAGHYNTGSCETDTLADWSTTFATNLFGPALLTQALLPLFSGEPLSIINVASTLGHRPTPNTAVYSASKAAMINWTKSLALELAADKIRVNCVCPGIVDTPIHSFHKFDTEEKSKALADLANLQPMGRIGQPKEVARAIYFLASQDSSWTTGAILDVDGGINL